MVTFYELGLNNQVIQATLNMGFEEATPIQAGTIPIAMNGRDLIAQAQTGTGKTAAYGIPMVERIMANSEQIQGIVLSPTRELAVQVAEELNKIGEIKVSILYRFMAVRRWIGRSKLLRKGHT